MAGWCAPSARSISVTLLVALGLGVNNFAARTPSLLPLIWATALLPGLVAGVMLFQKQTPR